MRAYSTGARAALAFPKRRGYSRQNSNLAAFRLIQEAAAMALRVMSADSHMDLVYLPPDTFTSRMDPKWGDAAPHVVERDGRKWWVSRDATLAADELRHCATLGLHGAVLVPWGSAMPVWHEMWEPVWSTAEETGLVVSFHVFEGGGATVGYEVKGIRHPAVIGSWTTVAPMQMDEICVSVILSGVCERHPKLRLVLGESGIGWLPYILERLDDTYEERLADDLKLPLPPSAYFKRQMYATFQKDFHGVRAMAEIAPDNVMWGSDYPHRDGTWPFSQKAIEEQFRGVDPAIQRKMLWENARRLYRIA